MARAPWGGGLSQERQQLRSERAGDQGFGGGGDGRGGGAFHPDRLQAAAENLRSESLLLEG